MMKTMMFVRVLFILGTVLGGTGVWAQSAVSLRFWNAGMPVTHAQVSVAQGGMTLGSGFTDANGQVTIPVPYLQGPRIDVSGTQQAGNTTRTWNLQGVVMLDARNSADVHLDRTVSPTIPNLLPGSLSTTWPPTNNPGARLLQPTGPANLGAFSPSTTTNANPSLGGIDLNQILTFNNATLNATDITGLQSAIDAMNNAGLGNSLNGYSIYMPNGNGSNTILKIPGGNPTPTQLMPFGNNAVAPTPGPKTLTAPKVDSTGLSTTKIDTTQPKVVNPATKPRVKLHIKSETGELISVYLDDSQVNPTPAADVVAQLPITYGLHPVVRVEFQNKNIKPIEQTLTLSGNQAQYDFVVRKNARGEWVVE
ncbi:MAG: hypothetical protein IPN95_08245 [Bacteroidetes bacterium]|nr:hypothetical protein [Bacteroidota bacterium]